MNLYLCLLKNSFKNTIFIKCCAFTDLQINFIKSKIKLHNGTDRGKNADCFSSWQKMLTLTFEDSKKEGLKLKQERKKRENMKERKRERKKDT